MNRFDANIKNDPKLLKQEIVVICFSLLAGFGFWVFDCLLSVVVFHESKVTDVYTALLDCSPHHLFTRLFFLFFCLVFGVLLAKYFKHEYKKQRLICLESNKTQEYLNMAEVILIALSLDGQISFINKPGCKLLGYENQEEVIGKNWVDNFIPKRDCNHMKELFRQVVSGEIEGKEYFENSVLTRKGEEKVVLWSSVMERDEEGTIVGVISFGTDLTQRKNTEEALAESEESFRYMSEAAFEGIVFHEQGVLLKANKQFFDMFGYKQEELIGKQVLGMLIAPESRAIVKKHIDLNKEDQCVVLGNKKDGSKFHMQLNVRNMVYKGRNIRVAGIMDISQYKEAEQKIKTSLKEKEVLLKEIHHRVKNNLQIISSLLSLQSEHVKHKDDLAIFLESKNRIGSMALIHEKLYQSRDFAKIDFKGYINSLVQELYNTYGIEESVVALNEDVQDVSLEFERAIPIGLIINELVSNALEYAFPENRKGSIDIQLYRENDKHVLIVRDNGVGLPEGFDFVNVKSLGLQLVSLLSEQVGGIVEITKKEGTEFRIIFSDGTVV